MLLESEADALAWYQSKPRILTKEFLDAIPWGDVKKHELAPAFVPVMKYMRDIEKSTQIYFEELRMTPTWRDKSVREFMERWVAEEPLHGDLLNRFLEEAGYPSEDKWFEKMKAALPVTYHLQARLQALVAHMFGRRFAGVHMTIGAVNELSTLSGYQRLWTLAEHPVLEQILRGIAREESRHYFFYWSCARIKLAQSGFAQKLNRTITGKFWVPVGQGIKAPEEANLVMRTLFAGSDGLGLIDRQVNDRMEDLPGLKGLKVVSERMRRAVESVRQETLTEPAWN